MLIGYYVNYDLVRNYSILVQHYSWFITINITTVYREIYPINYPMQNYRLDFYLAPLFYLIKKKILINLIEIIF